MFDKAPKKRISKLDYKDTKVLWEQENDGEIVKVLEDDRIIAIYPGCGCESMCHDYWCHPEHYEVLKDVK